MFYHVPPSINKNVSDISYFLKGKRPYLFFTHNWHERMIPTPPKHCKAIVNSLIILKEQMIQVLYLTAELKTNQPIMQASQCSLFMIAIGRFFFLFNYMPLWFFLPDVTSKCWNILPKWLLGWKKKKRNSNASIYTFCNENKILLPCMTFPKYEIQHFTQ